MSDKASQPSPPLIHLNEARKIAGLARLQFSEKELNLMARSMSETLTMMRILDEVDTSGTEPLLNPLDQAQALRADLVKEASQKDDLQALATDASDGYYKVPRVLD